MLEAFLSWNELACRRPAGRILDYLPRMALPPDPLWLCLLIQLSGNIGFIGLQVRHERAQRRAWAVEKEARRVRELAAEKKLL